MAETTPKPAPKPRKPKGPDHDALRAVVEKAEGYAPTQYAALGAVLEAENGAKVTTKCDVTIVTLAGLKAQSTAGKVNALLNWMNKARRILRDVA
jgi:hypothetical protein